MADICPVAIITGTPSHEGTATDILQVIRGDCDIHVATKPEQVYLQKHEFFSRSGLGAKWDAVITLIPTPTKQFFQTESGIAESNEEIAQAMNGLFAGFGAQAHDYPNIPHILIGHWNVSGSILPTGQVMTGKDIDIGYDSMMLACSDLICLGHIHKAQQIGERAFYPGSLYPLTWGELEAKGFYIHTLDGHKLIESRFIETPTRKLCRVSADYTKAPLPEKCEDFAYQLTSEIISSECEGASVRCDFTVWQDEAALIPKEEIKQLYLDAGAIDADIRIIRIPRETVRSEAVLKVNSLRDKIKAMADLRGETVSESILQKADLLEFREIVQEVAA